MRLLVSWLRDFVDVQAAAEEIGEGLGVRGFELAGIEPFGDGDAVIDFEVTANRPDCLSVIGLAREVATMYDLPLKTVRLKADTTTPSATTEVSEAHTDNRGVRLQPDLQVTIDEPELCPRYAAAIADITTTVTPAWMADRLRAGGVRPISAIVDVTNYVLLELGHPTHAFDLDKLVGPEIRVRRAKAGERLTTLDGVARTLDADMLAIADRDHAQAVAGVMGGAAAEVSATTKRVAFESAYFKPASVRRTSKRLGLKTEASSRFERGADIAAPVVALRRIAALIEEIAAGQVIAPFIDVHPAPRDPARLHLRRARLTSLLGAEVPDRDVDRILGRLGLRVSPAPPDGWDVIAPTFRVDLLREVDLIEEVGRHYGLDKLPDRFPAMEAPAPPPDARIPRDQTVRRVLTADGLSEAVTFGFIEAKAAEAFAGADGAPLIAVANPLSAKFDTLRPSLLPGLVDAVAHNRRHGREDVGLFEIGTRFSSTGETRAVGVAWTGSAIARHWSTPPRPVDFFDVKGAGERIAEALGVSIRYEPSAEPFLVAGQAARVVASNGASGGTPIGIAGQLAARIAEARGLPRQDQLFVVELDLDALSRAAGARVETVRSLPRHPQVVRDLSVLVADTLPAEIIRGTIQAAGANAPAPLVDVTFFDRYQGKGVPEGSVSLSLRMTFQAADRTLTDAEVQAAVDAILARLVDQHGAVRR